jgi:hypothetical protein
MWDEWGKNNHQSFGDENLNGENFAHLELHLLARNLKKNLDIESKLSENKEK